MTLYEVTSTYGKGRGEETMWKSVCVISDAVEKYMPEESKQKLLRDVYGVVSTGHYNEEFAEEDIEKMYYIDKNGNKHQAPYWPESAVKAIYDRRAPEIKDYNFYDFLVTMNYIGSNDWCMIAKWFPGISEADMNDKITDASISFLRDDDLQSKTKIWDTLNK